MFRYNTPVRIYTRTGDDGETGLFGGGRVQKDALRVEAYGGVDELNAVLGSARAHGVPAALDEALARIQGELFVVGADLATPHDSRADQSRIVRTTAGLVEAIERDIDAAAEGLAPLTTFILPGGGAAGAMLHLARTVCRRAERRVVTLAGREPVTPEVLPYLNRLSDLLFVFARAANAAEDRPEQAWLPE